MAIDDKLLQFLRQIVFNYLDKNKDKVFIFGSRIKGDNKKYSDIDLGFLPSQKISGMKLAEMSMDFEESNIPYKVDVVDFSKVSDSFKNIAMKNVYYLN